MQNNFYDQYKFLIVPIILWCGIQLFKVIYSYQKTKRIDIRRFLGAGGMPSSHSAVVVSVSTMIGKYVGINTPLFALSAIIAFITMYDAAGVRRAVGKQARVLNDILQNQKTTNAEKLQEMTGHTPIQVTAGALIGLVAGLIC
jgi:acid phosphatase family membrane protein YuiD